MNNHFFNQVFEVSNDMRVSVSSWQFSETGFAGSFAVLYLKNGKWEINHLSIRDFYHISKDNSLIYSLDQIRFMGFQVAKIYIEAVTGKKFAPKRYQKTLLSVIGKPVSEIMRTI